MSTDIILTTINARYVHPSFGLRYLLANMGPLKKQTQLLEFDLRTPTEQITRNLLSHNPRIIGIGVYIWNVRQLEQVVAQIRHERPATVIVLGGPEISYETNQQPIAQQADYVIRGEADLAFADLCSALLGGKKPPARIIDATVPDLKDVELPYHLYTVEDLAHKLTYIEISRGCPFKCEYCLSSLDRTVRHFPLDKALTTFRELLHRGATKIKFTDRTFNLDIDAAVTVMEFFLENLRPKLCVHFEMMPANFPEELRTRLRSFPPDSLRLEIGVQTFNTEVAQRVGRHQDAREVEDIFTFLREETNALVHADLIAGLPGEDLHSFGKGFNRLVALGASEIQVGILKRLRGVAIAQHDTEWAMVYNAEPPYNLLHNRLIDAEEMLRLNRFARYWEMIVNSGHFPCTARLLWGGKEPFESFMKLSNYLFDSFGATHGIALEALAERLWRYLVDRCNHSLETAAEALWQDYGRHHSDRTSRRLLKTVREAPACPP